MAKPNMPISSILILLFLSVLGQSLPAAASPTLSEMTHKLDQHFNSRLNKQKSTLTKIQVYIHGYFAGAAQNQTIFEVINPNISSSNFGQVLVIDNPLTAGPDPQSEPVGRYQGMNVFSDFQEASATMNMKMIFTGGEHKGNTVTIFGRQAINQKVRVLTVIAGTGAFRFARGIALASTISVDSKTKVGLYTYIMYIVTPTVEKASF